MLLAENQLSNTMPPVDPHPTSDVGFDEKLLSATIEVVALVIVTVVAELQVFAPWLPLETDTVVSATFGVHPVDVVQIAEPPEVLPAGRAKMAVPGDPE